MANYYENFEDNNIGNDEVGGIGFTSSSSRAITGKTRTTYSGTWRFIGKASYRSVASGAARSATALAIRIS